MTIAVSGPPRRAHEARVGYPYVLPLSATPDSAWASRFEAQEWAGLHPKLAHPYHPRLEGDLIWIAGFDPDTLVTVLDLVRARVDLITEELQELERQQAVERSRAEAQHAERVQTEDEIFDSWWRSQSRPS